MLNDVMEALSGIRVHLSTNERDSRSKSMAITKLDEAMLWLGVFIAEDNNEMTQEES